MNAYKLSFTGPQSIDIVVNEPKLDRSQIDIVKDINMFKSSDQVLAQKQQELEAVQTKIKHL